MTPHRLALLALLSLSAAACGGASSSLAPADGGSPPVDAAAPPESDILLDAGADAPATDAPAPSDAGDASDASCGYLIEPCCGGPAPLPDAAPCKPPPPFCAPLPASCSDGHSCNVCPSGEGIVDGASKTVQCLCA